MTCALYCDLGFVCFIYVLEKQQCSQEKVFSNFIEIALLHGCSPVNLLHNFRTSFPKNISEELFQVLLLFSNRVYGKSDYLVNQKTWTFSQHSFRLNIAKRIYYDGFVRKHSALGLH